jgi:hypothetical protein
MVTSYLFKRKGIYKRHNKRNTAQHLKKQLVASYALGQKAIDRQINDRADVAIGSHITRNLPGNPGLYQGTIA